MTALRSATATVSSMAAVTLEVDAYLTDRIILSLTGRERILWGTTTGHFHAQFGMGVKFIIH